LNRGQRNKGEEENLIKEGEEKRNLTNKLQLEVEKEENFFKKFLFPLFSCSIEVY